MRMSSIGLHVEMVNNNSKNSNTLNNACILLTAQQAQHSHLSSVFVVTIPILFTVAMPLLTRPNMVCFPAHQTNSETTEHRRVQ